MNSRTGCIVYAVGALVALVAALLVLFITSKQAPPSTSTSAQPTTQILTAKVELQPDTLITASDVQTSTVPITLAPRADYVTDVSQLKGEYTTALLLPGDPIEQAKLSSKPLSAVVPNIPAGYRAFGVPLLDQLTRAGEVQPGAFVDIIETFDLGTRLQTQTNAQTASATPQANATAQASVPLYYDNTFYSTQLLLPDVQVLDIKLASDKSNTSGQAVMVLAVTPQQAIDLAAAMNDKDCTLTYDLRAAGDTTTTTTKAVTDESQFADHKFVAPHLLRYPYGA